MKPILVKDLPIFLKRFDNFKDVEFRSIEPISPSQINLVFAVQDSAREFDWITIELEFSGVVDAKLLPQNRVSILDMSDGISLISFDNIFAFAVTECYNISSIKDSVCYILATSLKYREGSF